LRRSGILSNDDGAARCTGSSGVGLARSRQSIAFSITVDIGSSAVEGSSAALILVAGYRLAIASFRCISEGLIQISPGDIWRRAG
jgi:hypothetical protein